MKEHIRTAILTTALIAGFAAYGDPVILISDGVTSTGPITLTNNGTGSFSTSLFDGSWSVVVVAGESKPSIGSANSPNLELDIQATSLGSANPLTVILSDNNFGPTSGNATATFNGQAFGGAGSPVTFNTYYDTNNTLAALTTALTASGALPPSAYNSSASGSLSLTGPYSLSEVVTIPGTTAATYSLLANLQASNQPCTCTVSFTCPPDQMICASDTIPDPNAEARQIVATDTCLGIVPVTYFGGVTNGTGACPAVITYTFGATNGCGQLFTCIQTITVSCLPACTVTTVTNTVAGTSNLTASVQDAGTGASYAWTISNGTITAGQGTSSITYTAGNDTVDPIVICVTVTAAAGCQSSCCAMVPVTPRSCPCASHSIQYNFNGTQIIFQSTPGGSYVWFISDGVVKNLPSNQKVLLHISGQSITIPKTGSMASDITFPVPDAFITFDPSATVATTTFDTVNNVWRETFPSSGLAGNVFYGGVAFKVPASGLPGGIKNVDWTGTFTSDTAVNVSWQWSAANYSNFTGDYNSIAPKPTDDNKASIYKNSDHAGTPEGTDTASGKLWKTFVVGGASGGGGANYTGSGSSTISFPPCVCPNP